VLQLATHTSAPFIVQPEVLMVAVGCGGCSNFPSPNVDWRQIFELSVESYQAMCAFFRGLETIYHRSPAFFVPAGQFPVMDTCPSSSQIMSILFHGATPNTQPPFVLPPSTSLPPGTIFLPPRELIQTA